MSIIKFFVGLLGTLIVGGLIVAAILAALWLIMHIIMWILDELNI